jgi:G protein-coupled receptor GPR1
MLLIQSDMFKALWFMVYPIVTFTNGPVPSKSSFCQVNGFFLSLGIEASGTCEEIMTDGISNVPKTLQFS